MHHPPFAAGIQYMDDMGLREGSAELFDIVRRHPQVARVTCGHLHRHTLRRFAGTIAMTVPSTAHQIALDLRDKAPPAFRREPPSCVLHALIDGDVVSHLATLAECAEAELFADR